MFLNIGKIVSLIKTKTLRELKKRYIDFEMCDTKYNI